MRITLFWSLPAATVAFGIAFLFLQTSTFVSAAAECNASDSNEQPKDGACKSVDTKEGMPEKLPWWKDEKVTLNEIWYDILDCDEVVSKERPIHDIATWTMIREAYIAAVGIELSSFVKSERSNGFQDGSVVVKQSPSGKGRAVYAARRILKGDLLWKDDYTACFEEGLLYRRFLGSIPAHLSCDVLLWAYAGTIDGVCVDLDEASFINHASADIETKLHYEESHEKPNIVDVKDEMGEWNIAMRDIEVGEEILMDYSDFHQDDAWELLGLGRHWKDQSEDYDYESSSEEEEADDSDPKDEV